MLVIILIIMKLLLYNSLLDINDTTNNITEAKSQGFA